MACYLTILACSELEKEMKYLLLVLLATFGCASSRSITPPISDYVYGNKAIVNTNGARYDGLFDGKTVVVVGVNGKEIKCEYTHGDHVDTLYLMQEDLIKETN